MELTKNEREIMDVLWEAGRGLSRGEILCRAENKSWKDSSIHILLNSLLRKGAICESGFAKSGKTYGRMYLAAITCEEYHAGAVLENTKCKPSLPELVEVLLRESQVTEQTLDGLEAVIRTAREKSGDMNVSIVSCQGEHSIL